VRSGSRSSSQPAELAQEQLAVDVVDHRHARLAQPQRRQERDPVDDLDDHVGVAPHAAHDREDGAREDRRAVARPVDGQTRAEVLDLLRARIGPGHDGDAVPPIHPAADLRVDVRAIPAGVVVGPVPVGEQKDV
jgi:hypothetical protein